jgi:hypothetical protein
MDRGGTRRRNLRRQIASIESASKRRFMFTTPWHIIQQGNSKFSIKKVDALIERGKALAMDFLAPMPTEAQLEKELFENVAGVRSGVADQAHKLGEDDLRKLTRD